MIELALHSPNLLNVHPLVDDDLYSVVLDVSEIELEDDPVILAGC